MEDSGSATRFLVVLLLITIIAGGLVLVIKSDYRLRDNVLSNIEYYPHIQVDQGQD